jgi:hypothetical protein
VIRFSFVILLEIRAPVKQTPVDWVSLLVISTLIKRCGLSLIARLSLIASDLYTDKTKRCGLSLIASDLYTDKALWTESHC